MHLFKVSDMTHFFGGLRAVSDFSLELAPKELVGLIGPNGAGKTTVFNLISGIYRPTQGRIVLDNFDIAGLAPHKVSRLGIARTFQNIRIFHDMSVIDNIKVASRSHVEYGVFSALFHPTSFWKEEYRLDDYCRSLLRIFDLEEKASGKAGALPYGQQRKLEIARALATGPKILLLDEPAAGMNPRETHELIDTIAHIREEFDLTILIIEHNMHLIMSISERLVVMDFGETIAQGKPEEIRANPAVIEAYLGKDGQYAA